MEFIPSAHAEDSDSDSDSEIEEFTRGSDQYVNLTERFDQHKLSYILNHEDEFKSGIRPKCFEADYNPFSIMRKYLAASSGGTVATKYRQNAGVGRFYAEGSLSLQSLPREIRHTIAAGIYSDIDVVNAHPVILAHLCRKAGVRSKYLDRYNADRDTHLAELGVPREVGKTAVLSLMNGGSSDYDALPMKPEWIVKFQREMKTIHRRFATSAGFDDHRSRRIEAGKTHNHEASYMNVLLCDYENKILQCLWRGLGSPQDCVFCFDGIMVDAVGDLGRLEAAVFEELGIRITLKVKEMDQGLTLPADIPRYAEPRYNRFDFADKYDYHAFRKEFNGKEFSSYADLEEQVKYKLRGVIAFITVSEGMFIKKIGGDHDVVKKLCTTDFPMFYMEEGKRVEIKFQNYLTRGEHSFSNVCCNLDDDARDSQFNTWTGFQAVRDDSPTDEAMAGLELIKDLIMTMWAGGNLTYYNYIMSWIAGLFGREMNKIAIVMVSLPGCGKGTLIEILEFMLRKTNILNTIGLESITQKHNTAIQGKRLVVINEMSSSQSEFRSNFDKIKSYITDPVISIEPKGVNPYSINNISNFIGFTQHWDSMLIEKADRRYAVFEMSRAHVNDPEYFGQIRRKCLNQAVANAFYTYLLDFPRVSLWNIPQTELRQRMITMSLPSSHKYVEYALGDGRDEEETEVSAKVFYDRYVEWCRENGERSVSSTKFGINIADLIQKKKKKTGTFYILPPIQ